MAKRQISEATVRAVVTAEECVIDRYDGCSEYFGFDADNNDDRCIKVVVDNQRNPRMVVTAYPVLRRS